MEYIIYPDSPDHHDSGPWQPACPPNGPVCPMNGPCSPWSCGCIMNVYNYG
jgi:hypothetical protein